MVPCASANQTGRVREMARIEGQITIERPVEVVFDFVADQTNEPQYNPSMVRAEKVTPGPLGGSTRMWWSGQVRPKGALRLLGPLVTWMGTRQERRIWTSLKDHLEATADAGQ